MQHQFVVTGIKLLYFRDFSWYKIVYVVHALSCTISEQHHTGTENLLGMVLKDLNVVAPLTIFSHGEVN